MEGETRMALFATPKKHAENGPETWIVDGSGSNWWLRMKDGAQLEPHRRKRDAEAARVDGWAVRLYAKEGRWFAGEPVNGWKPYQGPSR
jgi:hypothetical protein